MFMFCIAVCSCARRSSSGLERASAQADAFCRRVGVPRARFWSPERFEGSVRRIHSNYIVCSVTSGAYFRLSRYVSTRRLQTAATGVLRFRCGT